MATMKLIIEKGPRSGEILEFKSGKRIRVGRLVRGNNVTIKDAGISSKHLSIEYDKGLGKWVVTDLDTFNGTILNSSQLKPLSPFVIDHGDVIKLGELTLIRVAIEGNNVEEGVDLEGNDGGEDEELEDRTGRGRGRGKKVREVEERNVERGMSTRKTRSSRREVVEEFVSLDVLPVRRSRRRAKNDVVEEGSKLDDVAVVESVETLGGRGSREIKKTDFVRAMVDAPPQQNENVLEDKVSSHVSGVGVAFPDLTQGSQCGSEEQRCEEPVCASSKQNEVKDEMNVSFLGEPRCEELMSTSNQQNEVEDDMNEGFSGENVSVQVDGDLYPREQSCAKPMYDTVQPDKPGDAMNDDISVEVEASLEPFNKIDQEIELNDKANIQVLEVEVSDNVGGSLCAPREEIMVGASEADKQTQDKLESDSASKYRIMEESVSGEILEETSSGHHGRITEKEPVHAPDLEKMTLGEWFDYLEVYLPKQIYDVTDEIIDAMRKRAKQFDEFVLEQRRQQQQQQQQKENGKLLMAP